MTKRIFRSILAVSLAVLLASSLLIVGVLHGYFQDSVLADLTIRTAYIAHGIENEGIVYLEEDLPGGCRITLVDTDGTVLYDNREDPAQMENHADREEIHEAAMLGQGRAATPTRCRKRRSTMLCAFLTARSCGYPIRSIPSGVW